MFNNINLNYYYNIQLFDITILVNSFVNYLTVNTLLSALILLFWGNIWSNQLLTQNYYKILVILVVSNIIIFLYYLTSLFYFFMPSIFYNDLVLSEKLYFSSDIIVSIKFLGFSQFLYQCVLSKFILSFLLLFLILYLIVFITIWHDYGLNNLKFYFYFLIIFNLIYLLLLFNNIIIFYFIYEAILVLVFAVMYLSSYSRSAVDALLYFLVWAIIGSILVAYGIILILYNSQVSNFSELIHINFTFTEFYYIYLLLFFGFGVKLSIWPFWFWLPKAHVEVSTGMSIFLSCVLIKLSLFALLKIQYYIYITSTINICILVCFFCVIDIMFRFLNLRDLKAVIAYSSVLHTNLLVALLHFDNIKVLSNSILYIWGHSLATAGLFWCVLFIELKYSTRNIIKISGLWYNDSKLGRILFFNVLSFIDIPITLMFWGELWLWLITILNHPLLSLQLYAFACILFIIFFFKIWWGVLLGVPNNSITKTVDNNFYLFYFTILYIIFFQLLVGFQPALLKFLVI